VDKEPRVRDLDVPRRAFAVTPAQNATSEDCFVKSKRSLDVGDGEKVCDGNPILRRHLIGFLLDLYFAHGRLLFGLGGYKAKRYVEQSTDQSDRMFGQERKNETRDLVVLLVQGEMAGVEQVDFRIRKIAL